MGYVSSLEKNAAFLGNVSILRTSAGIILLSKDHKVLHPADIFSLRLLSIKEKC